MVIRKRQKLFAILLFVVLTMLNTVSVAKCAEVEINSNVVTNTSKIASRSIDTTFTLDFNKSTTWTIDFTNRAFPFANHQFVTVEYLSCSPTNSKAKVSVELYIDEDKDGIYEQYDPNGEYLFMLTVGDKYSIALPYGTTVKNYRLVFANKTSSVSSGDFSVKTE